MLTAAILLVATTLLVFGAILWRSELVMALPFLTIFNGMPLSFGGTALRVDQLAASVLVIPLAASILAGRRRLAMDSTSWLLAALLVMNVVASVVNSPARSYSLMQCLNLMSAWVIYVMLLNGLDTREDLTRAFTRSLWAAMLAAIIGISAFALELVGLHVGGAEVSQSAAEHLSMAYGSYGTMVEPNIFGSFTGAFLVICIGMLAVAPKVPAVLARTSVFRATAILCAIGIVLSFTRAAWLGAIVGILFFVALGRRTFGIRTARLIKPMAVGLAVVLVLLVLPGTAGDFFRFKLFNIVNLESRTGESRLLTAALALGQTVEHPIIGYGTFTFAPLVAQGLDFSSFEGWRSIWIGNFVLLALHDTGVIGLLLWIALIWSIVARAIRSMRALVTTDPEVAARILALTAALASMLISFLATTGFSLGYPWLLIGLLGAHCRVAMMSAAERAMTVEVAPSSPEGALLPADAT